ncbi:mucin-binding protein [Limosilactobacillus fastidiosus]|uniref:LPXTG cell wall anchor domain-containing protein n=1 Tax=Limosilactobacillus fastidiosus TaxID=2759855 RepID=A0ABR6E801_9LACO|nr:LPXTG cell wall anchor domain-containing protein [Limosilactobacillus fastidiosus]MBB1063324.1 LPXTG cell wall anchor domain-containing protein [Limosilactobacillus fastidiosus]MCD7084505.1 LPXTG cell wall anchor domain-containing protein [Limosilactobacillus fastidiosus]
MDPSRVKVDSGEVAFGGNYTNSNVFISSWSNGSSGFNNSQETKDAIAKNPELIGGFSVSGTLKANETVNIIIPLKVTNTEKTVVGGFERQFGQHISMQVSPEDFRDANEYTNTDLTVDGLTDSNISNLADNNGELTVSGQITNNGFIPHDESLVFNLSSVDSTDNHKVQTVLDHDKAIQLDWDNANDNNITYYVDGTFKTSSQMTDSDWNHVTKVKVNASLQSGQTGKVTIPVKLSNLDQIETDLQNLNDIGPANNRQNAITLSAQSDNNNLNGKVISYYSELPAYGAMKAIEDEINGKVSIIPSYLFIDKDGKYNYVRINDIKIPQLGKDYFSYLNVGHNDPSNTLFTDGYYTIKLDKIFDTFKDHGFSVNISNINNQEATWPTYYYDALSGNKNDYDQLYVQLQQIFDTKDLTLMAGDSWNSNDSLNSANVNLYNLYSSAYYGVIPVGRKNLKATGDYTYDLYDASGKQIDKDVPVGQNVPTLPVGTYKVVYHYQINKDEEVSKTATIVVNGKATGTPLVTPVNPQAAVTTINYIDYETGTTLFHDEVYGTLNSKVDYVSKVPNFEKQGYVLVSSDIPSKNDGKVHNVVLIKPIEGTYVDPEQPTKSSIVSGDNLDTARQQTDEVTPLIHNDNIGVTANTSTKSAVLPQTGNKQAHTGIIGLALASVAMTFGLGKKKED